MNNIRVRPEAPADFDSIENIIVKAFENFEKSNKDEYLLVRRLRISPSYIQELALVAEIDGVLSGHVLFTQILIRGKDSKPVESLALAPISVHPEFQGRGIGTALIQEGHRRAKKLGYRSVILLGHPSYYPRFGYKPASSWGIKAPFEVRNEAFMALELFEGALFRAAGIVEYPKEFEV